MKSKFIASAIIVVFLFTGVSVASFAQDKTIKQQVKPKTETIKQEVKTKTEEGIKNQTQLDNKKIEQTKEKIKHHKTKKHSDLKETKEPKSETKK